MGTPSTIDALRAYRRRDFNAAAELFRNTVEANPLDASAWKGLACAHARTERWDDALAAAGVLVEQLPEDPRAWSLYVRCSLRAERVDLALPAMQRIAHLKPQCAAAHYTLGVLFYEADRVREAGEALGRAVALQPEYADAHFLLGLVHLHRGDASSAANQLRLLRPLNAQLADQLQRAIAPHRQSLIIGATIVVLTLWLSAGKMYVPPKYGMAWQIGGFVLFMLAFVAYRAFQHQAHPEGLPPSGYWGENEKDQR